MSRTASAPIRVIQDVSEPDNVNLRGEGTAKVSPPGERAAGTGSRRRGATVLTMPAVGILPFDAF
jgi:hypothetical protein